MLALCNLKTKILTVALLKILQNDRLYAPFATKYQWSVSWWWCQLSNQYWSTAEQLDICWH